MISDTVEYDVERVLDRRIRCRCLIIQKEEWNTTLNGKDIPLIKQLGRPLTTSGGHSSQLLDARKQPNSLLKGGGAGDKRRVVSD